MALALLAIGAICLMVGGIWILVLAFSDSVLWGLGCLCVPFVSLIFVITHFEEAKKPFFIQLIGLAFYVGAAVIGGGTPGFNK